MTTLESAWKSLVTPLSTNAGEAQREYMTRVILAITLIVLVVGSIPVIIGWGLINFDLEAITILFILDISITSVGYLAWRGYWRISSYLPPAIFFFLAVYGTYNNGMLTSYLIFYVAGILLVFMLHGAKAQWAMLILTLTTYLWLSWSFNPMYLLDEERLTISITVCSSFVCIALLTWFSNRELHQALNKTRMFATDLEIARDNLLQTNTALETQNHMAASLRSANSRTEMLPIILEQVAGLFDTSHLAIGFLGHLTREVNVELGLYHSANLTGKSIKAGEGITGYVLEHGKPYVTNAAPQDPLILKHLVSNVPQAVAGIPLIAKQEAIGVLMAGRDRPFLDEDIRLLTAICDMAANAIQRVTLHEETQLRMHRLNAFYNIEKALSINLDIETALNMVLDQLVIQLGIHAADILQYETTTQTLTYVSGRGFQNTSLYNTMLRIGKGFASQVALERKLIYIPDLREVHHGPVKIQQMIVDEGFVSYFGLPMILKGQVKGVMELYYRHKVEKDPEWLSFLETLARQTANAIDNAVLFEDLQKSNLDLTLAYDTTLEGWAKALELRDKETEGHSQNVTELTIRLARALGLKKEELVNLRRGALLHDIGKMGIPDNILFKPGPLSSEEWEIMKQHPTYAYHLLSSISFLHPALDIPYCHHEWWDGSGYPRGLKGEEIPLSARIFAIIDVWDALLSDRPYRKAWSRDQAISYIQEMSGKQFDPVVVDVFMKIIHQIPAP